MIPDHKRNKRHKSSRAIAAENSCPEVTEVVSSNAKAKKCDAEPARAMQKKLGVAQSIREASIANTGHPRADADPSGVTQSQHDAKRG